MPLVDSILLTSTITSLELPLVDQAPSIGGLYIIQDSLKSLHHPQSTYKQCVETGLSTLIGLSS